MRVAVRAATSDRARNFSAHTGANAAMTAVSDFAAASFSAAVRPMKPNPYERSHMPTSTPAAPLQRQGFTTDQLIVMLCSSEFKEYAHGPSGVGAKLLPPAASSAAC